MYSACRSRLATERHLRPCNRDIIFAVPLFLLLAPLSLVTWWLLSAFGAYKKPVFARYSFSDVRHVQRFHGFLSVTCCPLLLPMRNLQVACALSLWIIGLREKGESNPPLMQVLARCSVYGSFSPRCPYLGAVRVFPCCRGWACARAFMLICADIRTGIAP